MMLFNRKCVMAVVVLGLSTPIFAGPVLEGQVGGKPETAAVALSTAPKVNINQATLKELMKVKGLNRVKARNILSYRHKHDQFQTLDDLKKVKGFSKMKEEELKAIENQLTIE